MGDDDTLTLMYTPNNDMHPHYALTGNLTDASTLILDPNATVGVLDRREGAYIGSTLRLIPTGNEEVQERIIGTHVRDADSNWIVTVRTPFDAGIVDDASARPCLETRRPRLGRCASSRPPAWTRMI